MRATWQDTDGFSAIWSISIHQPDLAEGAVGKYPSNQGTRFAVFEPVAQALSRSGIRLYLSAFRSIPRTIAPRALPHPQVEPQPSELAAQPGSLANWKIEQSQGHAWPLSGDRQVWDLNVCKISYILAPEYALQEIKPRIWRRGAEARHRYGLGMTPATDISWTSRQLDLSGQRITPMQPEFKNTGIHSHSASDARVMAANLHKLNTFGFWAASDILPDGAAPLRFLAPGFGISVPDPAPLR